ncbi:Rieske (2Fe-2S) protein [Mucilaginibacter boryungensis]|uniref:Rieske 2Fe-2S domain-containing protein n=1 Tax=Mucilaginibacter boryungensis TaxID=768480 RepID=A0ABR9XGH0_9SPHI|nr:Rieske 2Fe-2S domain-containing protein [Mucilaginibacter boryungensis]MBE9666477.1 Rieske 2Fe-2S domain-containing protein [Mucilaginibacter boryungensis]
MKWYNTGVTNTDKPFIKRVSVGGHNVCLVGYGGHIYALANKCPHAGEDLSRGWCTEGKIVCAYHRFSYSLETGKGSPGQNDYVNTYAVKVEDGMIFVGFNTFREKLKSLFQ